MNKVKIENTHNAVRLLEEAAILVQEAKQDAPERSGELSLAHEQIEIACNQLLETIKRIKGSYNA